MAEENYKFIIIPSALKSCVCHVLWRRRVSLLERDAVHLEQTSRILPLYLKPNLSPPSWTRPLCPRSISDLHYAYQREFKLDVTFKKEETSVRSSVYVEWIVSPLHTSLHQSNANLFVSFELPYPWGLTSHSSCFCSSRQFLITSRYRFKLIVKLKINAL